MPEMWLYTPLTGTMPSHCGRYPGERYTKSSGTTPSAMMRFSPYTSRKNRFSARTRCESPRSSCAHSRASMTRGIASNGNSLSSNVPFLYIPNFTPYRASC